MTRDTLTLLCYVPMPCAACCVACCAPLTPQVCEEVNAISLGSYDPETKTPSVRVVLLKVGTARHSMA